MLQQTDVTRSRFWRDLDLVAFFLVNSGSRQTVEGWVPTGLLQVHNSASDGFNSLRCTQTQSPTTLSSAFAHRPSPQQLERFRFLL